MFDAGRLRCAVLVVTLAILGVGRSRAPDDGGEGVIMEFVRIPAGEFMMGSPAGESGRRDNEGSQHRVRITEPFYISTTEVTQQQYDKVMWHNPSVFKGSDNPVEGMSWGGASAFCRTLSKKTGREITLPTEAQWEYACRAGTDTRFSFDDDEQSLDSYCWYEANSSQHTQPVAMKKPNAWGLYDMHGNVQEWCSDEFEDLYYSHSLNIDPEGPSILRVVRGGSHAYVPGLCRSASRRGSSSDNRNGVTGFRVVFPGKDGNGKRIIRVPLGPKGTKTEIASEKEREVPSRGWRMIAGTARDEAGTPVDSAEMEILPLRHWNLSRYDGVGFEAVWQPERPPTPMDEYLFVARHAKRNLVAVKEITKDTDTLDVVLQPGTILTGKVVDGDGNAMEEARITIRLKGPNWLEIYPWYTVWSDAEGKFDIRALPPDRAYVLIAWIREYGMARLEFDSDDARDNQIDAGSIVLAKGDLSVSGVVVDEDGKQVADVGVYCSGKDQVGITTRTDPDGRFKADGIFKGQVRVTADLKASDGRWLHGYLDTEAGATDVRIVLRDDGTPPPKGRTCFTGETGVWVDGAVVPLSEVARGRPVGHDVYAVLALPFGHVERIEEHEGVFECRDIVLDSGNCISVVDAHCFMLDSGKWIAAQNLRNGLKLKTTTGTVGIKSVTVRATPYVGKVYNLKIANSDRYAMGRDGVIVRDY